MNRSDDDQTTAPESHTGFQGEGASGGCQRIGELTLENDF
jgi:hypothetical protein